MLAHVHSVCTRPFLPAPLKEPGDEANFIYPIYVIVLNPEVSFRWFVENMDTEMSFPHSVREGYACA